MTLASGSQTTISLPPDNAVNEQRGEIATPSCSTPADALAQKIWVVFESGEQLCLLGKLDGDLPTMVYEEASHEVVVIRSDQGDAEPGLVSEFVYEVLILDDAIADGKGPTGQTRDASIDMRSC